MLTACTHHFSLIFSFKSSNVLLYLKMPLTVRICSHCFLGGVFLSHVKQPTRPQLCVVCIFIYGALLQASRQQGRLCYTDDIWVRKWQRDLQTGAFTFSKNQEHLKVIQVSSLKWRGQDNTWTSCLPRVGESWQSVYGLSNFYCILWVSQIVCFLDRLYGLTTVI